MTACLVIGKLSCEKQSNSGTTENLCYFSRVKNVQGQQILVIVIAEAKKKKEGMDGILNNVP